MLTTLTSLPLFFAQASAPSLQSWSSAPTAPQEIEIVAAPAACPQATTAVNDNAASSVRRIGASSLAASFLNC